MREIKFRAWDSLHKDISEPFSLGEKVVFLCEEHGNHGTFQDCLGNHQFTVMQYTGLKDKNGVEIYEGDVLLWLDLQFAITIEDFHGYRFMFGKDQLCKAYAIDGEVIGNIYENPGLIND